VKISDDSFQLSSIPACLNSDTGTVYYDGIYGYVYAICYVNQINETIIRYPSIGIGNAQVIGICLIIFLVIAHNR
jgi:hypothetical protein